MPDTPSLLPGWGAWAGQRKKTPQWIVDAQDKATKYVDGLCVYACFIEKATCMACEDTTSSQDQPPEYLR